MTSKKISFGNIRTSWLYIYIKIKKYVYGLKQASVLSYQQLLPLLKNGGYKPILGALGMWKLKTRKTLFCLCVDDFGLKYYSKEDGQHLYNEIASKHTYKIYWEGHIFRLCH